MFRLSVAGARDPSFGDGGAAVTDFGGGDDGAGSALVQVDGKLIAAGASISGSGAVSIAACRYLPNGSLDPTFGTGGRTLTTPPPNAYLSAQAARLGDACTFVVVGVFGYDQNTLSNTAMGLARYRR